MPAEDVAAAGFEALDAGRWADARAAFERSIAERETADALFGLANALWWQGENRASVLHSTRAYALFRRTGDDARAVECALWLAITYKANFANFVTANGWIRRAERLLEQIDVGSSHGWAWVTKAYRMADLDAAEELSQRAFDLARRVGDIDLELTALSQVGLIRVSRGDSAEGFALIDEAMAAALGGEGSSLVTVVYTCCDMLNVCELASDAERAAHWCDVADTFVARYGCPFLYAECRIYFGSVLTAKGKWHDAERELDVGPRITEGACPGLHRRALVRLAALRIRQGRLEEADSLLAHAQATARAEAEGTLAVAALMLARGHGLAASRHLEPRWRDLADHRSHAIVGTDLLVDAYLAVGDVDAATAAVERLQHDAATVDNPRLEALAASVQGRVDLARGDTESARSRLERAANSLADINVPFEAGRVQIDLARIEVDGDPSRAIDHARRALACFEELGAAREADRAAAFLRSLGVVARVGPKGSGALTRREQEVLELIGHGLTNPEIATRLHVTRKTASHHVSSILTKLDLRNRTEAAAFAAGLTPRSPS